MFERHIGDTINSPGEESTAEEIIMAQVKLKKGKNNIEHITVSQFILITIITLVHHKSNRSFIV